MQIYRVLVAVAVIAACSPKPADTEGDTGSSGSSGTTSTGGGEVTSATHTSPTTSGFGSSSSGGPSSVTMTASSSDEFGEATTTPTMPGPTSESGEETGGSGGLVGACEAVCILFEECDPGSVGPIEKCVEGCVAEAQEPPGCPMATTALWECVAGLTCEEAQKFREDEKPTSCLAELAAVDEACAEECGGEIGGDQQTCEFLQECGGLSQSIMCDTTTCTCEENGMAGKECPADGLCELPFEEQRAAINACCGFDWK